MMNDFNLDGHAAIDVESWDAGFIDSGLLADQSGSDSLSQYEPSINMASGRSNVGVDVSSFSGFNFRNTLRDATLSNNTTLPDLPWETPMSRCIFDESSDPLESMNPTRLLSGPALPVLPRDGDELRESLVANNRTVQSLDEKIPIFSLAVGHRRDVSWEEKREADVQRSLMKWTSIVLTWPEEWPICQAFNESETAYRCANNLAITLWGRRQQH